MLQILKVFNFALIEQAEVEFSAGFNVLTGETGAGKSILIDALSVVLGGRASVDMIRSGCEQFRVEAVFDLQQHRGVLSLLTEQAIPQEEDGSMFLSRTVSRQGRNTVLINGTHAPLSLLRTIGDLLLDMHGQHENQALLRPESYLDLLDASDSRIAPLLSAYRSVYGDWRQTGERITAVDKDERQRAQRFDMLSWQAEEIEAARLAEAEEEDLPRRIRLLTHAEKIGSAVGNAWAILSEGGRQGRSVIDSLQECRRSLENAARYDETLTEFSQQIGALAIQLEDLAPDLRNYLDGVEADPAGLSRLQERMDQIYRLKQKYGPTVAEILAYGRKARQELEELGRHEERLAELRQQLQQQERELAERSLQLHLLRSEAARTMGAAIETELHDLGMPGAHFSVDVTPTGQYSASGGDAVRFGFSANPGEEKRLLSKVASGGELSRTALAIKTACAGNDGAQVMVFDEIDAGVGGQTARKVAEKIGQVAARRQVLCVTHLPQIAAMADCHIHIEKRAEANRTWTLVTRLSPMDRLTELARMIGGEPVTQAGLENAAEMIRTAATAKPGAAGG